MSACVRLWVWKGWAEWGKVWGHVIPAGGFLLLGSLAPGSACPSSALAMGVNMEGRRASRDGGRGYPDCGGQGPVSES